MTADELTGRTRSHVIELPDVGCVLHRDAAQPFLDLREAARAAGHELVAVSSFRDFDRQRLIWNGKFRGARAVLDRQGRLLDLRDWSVADRINAILYWSAMPGASRHHWGSDFDVIDRNAVAHGTAVELVPEAYRGDGPHAALSAWLSENMTGFGFFRPYVRERAGVSPEPWHLSYAPLSVPALQQMTPAVLLDAWRASEIDGVEWLIDNVDLLHARYVQDVDLRV
jgi:LAS superfamily LD-carboxypeptidase LdcB